MEVKFLDEYLAMKAKMKAQADEMAEGVIIDIKKMFTDKNIKRLGLWHIELTDSQEPNYKEEDKKLFADVVAPGFRGNLLEIQEFLANGGKSADLSFGGEDGYIDGLIFGIEEDGDSIAFVGYDSEHEDVVRIPALDAYNDTENWKISYDDIILSISESICTNINNNIPVDKWDVAHCSNIDPYTWKILGGASKDDLEEDFDDSELSTTECSDDKPETIEAKIDKYSGKEDISQAFSYLEDDVRELNLTSLNVENATNMHSMRSCGKFRKVYLSNLKANKVTTMKTLFECCENLEEVNLNGFEASNVEVTLNNM